MQMTMLTLVFTLATVGCAAQGLDAGRGGGADAGQRVGQATQFSPAQLAQFLTADAAYLYWTTQNQGIRRAPLGGGEAATLVLGEPDAWQLAVDRDNIYWVTLAGDVRKAPLAGGSAVTLASGASVSGIAVDGDSLYWATGSQTPSGNIMRLPLGGGPPSVLATVPGGPEALTIDADNVYVATLDSVFKVAKSSGTVERIASGQAGNESIAVDATGVYWLDNNLGAIWKTALDGGLATAVASGLPRGQSGPYYLAVDRSGVYWTNGSGTIEMAALPSLARYVIATGQDFPSAITLAAGNVYWANQGASNDDIFTMPEPQ